MPDPPMLPMIRSSLTEGAAHSTAFMVGLSGVLQCLCQIAKTLIARRFSGASTEQAPDFCLRIVQTEASRLYKSAFMGITGI
jgi:hypothetical protein